MSKKFLLYASIFVDILDFTGIGHFLYFFDIILIVMHFVYAGPKAIAGILDMIPVVGFLPVFTIMSLTHDK